MSTNVQPNWSDAASCPYCESDLADPGAGFVDHVAESPDCLESYAAWKERVASDVPAGWSG